MKVIQPGKTSHHYRELLNTLFSAKESNPLIELEALFDWMATLDRVASAASPEVQRPGYYAGFPRFVLSSFDSIRYVQLWNILLLDQLGVDSRPLVGLFVNWTSRSSSEGQTTIRAAEELLVQLMSDDPGHRPLLAMPGVEEGRIVVVESEQGQPLLVEAKHPESLLDSLAGGKNALRLVQLSEKGVPLREVVMRVTGSAAHLTLAEARWYSQASSLTARLFRER